MPSLRCRFWLGSLPGVAFFLRAFGGSRGSRRDLPCLFLTVIPWCRVFPLRGRLWLPFLRRLSWLRCRVFWAWVVSVLVAHPRLRFRPFLRPGSSAFAARPWYFSGPGPSGSLGLLASRVPLGACLCWRLLVCDPFAASRGLPGTFVLVAPRWLVFYGLLRCYRAFLLPLRAPWGTCGCRPS